MAPLQKRVGSHAHRDVIFVSHATWEKHCKLQCILHVRALRPRKISYAYYIYIYVMTNSCFTTQPNLEKNTCKNKERTTKNTLEASGITILEKQKTLGKKQKLKQKSNNKNTEKSKELSRSSGDGAG